MCAPEKSCKCDKSWRHAWKFEQVLRLELERELVLHGASTETIRKAHDKALEEVGPIE